MQLQGTASGQVFPRSGIPLSKFLAISISGPPGGTSGAGGPLYCTGTPARLPTASGIGRGLAGRYPWDTPERVHAGQTETHRASSKPSLSPAERLNITRRTRRHLRMTIMSAPIVALCLNKIKQNAVIALSPIGKFSPDGEAVVLDQRLDQRQVS